MLRYVPAQFIPPIAGFILIAVLTRLLTPADFGVYALIGTTVTVLGAVTDGWLANAVLRFYPEAESAGFSRYFKSSLVLYVVGGTLLTIVTAVPVMILWHPELPISLSLAGTFGAILLLVNAALNVSQAVLRAQRRAWAFSVSTSSRAFARLVSCAAGGILIPNHVLGVLLGWLGSTVIAAAGTMLALRMFGSKSREKAHAVPSRTQLLRQLLKYGVPVSGSLLMGLVLSDADRFLLQDLTTTRTVGIYSAIYSIANGSLAALYPLVMSASFPILIHVWDEPDGKRRVRELLPAVMRYFFLLTTPATLGLILLAPTILSTLTPGDYAVHREVMTPVALGVFFLGVGQFTTVGLLLAKRTMALSCIMAIAAVMNLALNVVLIPAMGMFGAGLATLAAYLCYAVVGTVLGGRYLRASLLAKPVLHIAVACLFMGVVLVLVQGYLPGGSIISLGILLLVGAAAYILILVMLGELRSHGGSLQPLPSGRFGV